MRQEVIFKGFIFFTRSNFFSTLMAATPSSIIRWVWDLLEIEKLVKLRSNLRLRLVALRTAKNVLLCNVGSDVGVGDDNDRIDDRDRKIILANIFERIEKTQWKEVDSYALTTSLATGIVNLGSALMSILKTYL